MAIGSGLVSGVAGEQSSFVIQTRDSHQSEVQVIKVSTDIIDVVHEVQTLTVSSKNGGYFALMFRGEVTSNVQVGFTSLGELKEKLELLPTIMEISISSNGSAIINHGDVIDVTFLSELGNLERMTSTGGDDITKKVIGETPFRTETQVISCDANSGSIVLLYEENSATLQYNDDMPTVELRLSNLLGSPVNVVDDDHAKSSLCALGGQSVHVVFDNKIQDVQAISIISSTLQNGSMEIYGNGEEIFGAVNGIGPIMGSFTLSFEGSTTSDIEVSASAYEMQSKLEDLPTIGSVSVSKDIIGLSMTNDGVVVVSDETSLLSVWTVIFADASNSGCESGSWGNCPANIGDVDLLVADSSSLEQISGISQHPNNPKIDVFESTKGSMGNDRSADSDLSRVKFFMQHSLHSAAIGMHEVQTIECKYDSLMTMNDSSRFFLLHYMSESITVNVTTTLEQFENLLLDFFSVDVSVTGTHMTVCDTTTASTQIRFNKASTKPTLFASSVVGLSVHISTDIDGFDDVQYIGSGQYKVSYTPVISGHYAISVSIGSEQIWTDLSNGVYVEPSIASAPYSSHNSVLYATEGVEEKFMIQAKDRFGNDLVSSLLGSQEFEVEFIGKPDKCSGREEETKFSALLEKQIQGKVDATYNPGLAGVHQVSITLTSPGGLLASFYKNIDFSNPVLGNTAHMMHPYHEVSWCPSVKTCDSTRLDALLAFDWKYGSPLPDIPNFPIDYFSITWKGYIKPPTSDQYIFVVIFNGGVRLTIGTHVIMDEMEATSTTLNGSVYLEANRSYPILLEYVHYVDKAMINLQWKTESMPLTVIPASFLLHTRHIAESSSMSNSPFDVTIIPGNVDSSSTASGGKNLQFCLGIESL